MARAPVHWLFIALAACAGDEGAPGAADRERPPGNLEAARRRSRAQAYAPPPPAEIARAEALFALLLAPGPNRVKAAAQARQLGLELHEVAEAGGQFLMLIEPEAAERGWGLYVFRAGGTSLAIEAPHSFEDLHTGAIAVRLFLEGRAAAAALSTAPRAAPAGSAGERADLAHLADGVFHAFTRAFAAAHPKGIVLQVHGFDGERWKKDGPPLAEVILSDGTRSPPPWLLSAATCLEDALPVPVAVYPHGAGELGGTTNVQGKLLRARGHSGFLHLEIGLGLRRRLKDEPELRKELLRCLPERHE